ncbi:MAG: hypothetical protein COT43_04575 [Candidatus Marinimicrobia bacterium CG08_land_8_20_14_0_20_45_22]|nr:MAG: hypothetical protein COT43_04575 [Candidatus Marinimicrobia bacterium CG08_land_8_20_14_0_20_45_22]
MLTRLSIEVDRSELAEFREVMDKLTQNKPTVEIKVNPYLRSICRQILKEIDRWEEFKKERM